MMLKLWAWLVVADEQITCSFTLFSISFTLNILLSSIPSARKRLFGIVRSLVHESVVKTVNANTLANIDDNCQSLVRVGKVYRWLIAPFYRKDNTCGKWLDALVTCIMVCLATASVVLIALENKSRLGLLFCMPFSLFFLINTLFLFLWFGLIKLLECVIQVRCAPKNEPQREKASEVFAEIADVAGVNNPGTKIGSSDGEKGNVGKTEQGSN